MGGTIDFSSIGGKKVEGAKLDFSSIGGTPVEEQSQTAPTTAAKKNDTPPQSSGFLSAIGEDISGMARGLKSGLTHPGGYTIEETIAQQKAAGEHRLAQKKAGYGTAYRTVAGWGEGVGVNTQGMEEAAARGDTRGVLGHTVLPTAMAVSPLAAEGALKAIPKLKSAAANALAPKVAPGLSPEASVRMASPEARLGTENIIRAGAPAAGKIDFRESASIAAPDLAEIERKSPLSKSGTKGGIIKPDLRVRQWVTSVNNYLDQLWNNVRMPQITKHATVPVDTIPGLSDLSPETLKGLSRKMKGQLPPSNRTLTLQQTDDLLHGVNAYLRAIEGKTPEAQAIARITNPQIDALYDLKGALRQSISKTLERLGEPGIQDFDMRYGALSDVRDSVRSQMNPAEAERLLDKVTGYAGIKGGLLRGRFQFKSTGARLQRGMEQLAKSPLHPEIERTAAQMQKPLRPALPPAPESATLEPVPRVQGGLTPANAQVEEAYPVRPGVTRKGSGLRSPEQIASGGGVEKIPTGLKGPLKDAVSLGKIKLPLKGGEILSGPDGVYTFDGIRWVKKPNLSPLPKLKSAK